MQTMSQHQQETSWPKPTISNAYIRNPNNVTTRNCQHCVYQPSVIEKLYEKDPPFASTFVELDKTDHSNQELEGWMVCILVGMMTSFELLGYCSYKVHDHAHDHDYILATA